MKLTEYFTVVRRMDRETLRDWKVASREWVQKFQETFEDETLAKIGFGILGFFSFVAVFAPYLAPYDPMAIQYGSDGQVLRGSEPIAGHWFGTTNMGRDVLSQVIWSSRVSIIVGVMAAFVGTFIGTNLALISGYVGGKVDEVIMRVVDILYALPILPMLIALVFIFGASLQNFILVIGLLIWRSSARVVRSEVLTQKERPYVESAKASGAGSIRIMYRHILPNVLPIVVLYVAFGVAWAVIFEASISFLGFGDPESMSWGVMMNQAYMEGGIRHAWWWVLPPGFSIMLLVMAVFFIGRALERITNPELGHNR